MCGGNLFSNKKGRCYSFESVNNYIYIPGTYDTYICIYVYTEYIASPADVRLGHDPYPRNCLAVLGSLDTAQNACFRLSSCTRRYVLCGGHLCFGHYLMESSRGYTAVQKYQIDFFSWRSAVVYSYISAKSTKPALRR